MGDGISNQFKNSLVERSVTQIFDRLEQYYGKDIDGPGGIDVSEAVLTANPGLDKNGDRRLNRTELRTALTQDKFILSLENANGQEPRRAAFSRDLSQTVVNFVDAEDGIPGGQIRVSGNDISAGAAVGKLTSGAWVFGKVLGDVEAAQRAGYKVIELHVNKSAPKFTNR